MPAAQSEVKPQGGLFKGLKQKIDSGQSLAPALASQLPALRPNTPDAAQEQDSAKTSKLAPTQPNESDISADKKPQAAASQRPTKPASANTATKGNKQPRAKQKLSVGSSLSEQFADANSKEQAPKRKVSLPVGKALIIEQRVGINQSMAPDLNVRREQKKVEEEARLMLERDLEQLEKAELRRDEDPSKAIRAFFSDTIPALFSSASHVTSSNSLNMPDAPASHDTSNNSLNTPDAGVES
jgi:hypothetical protein